MTFEEMKKRRLEISASMDTTLENVRIITDESSRVVGVLQNAEEILADLDAEFERKTGLTKTDAAFLFTAIGLQIARQYLVTNFKERLDDKSAANKTKGHKEEHSDRTGFKYNPPLTEVISNPVPFDAIFGSADLGLDIGGGFGHRAKTLGHDPILGWIFGTANIATSTLTAWNFNTYHVETGYTANGQRRDKIVGKADTLEMLGHVADKLCAKEGNLERLSVIKTIPIVKADGVNSKLAGPAIIAASLMKEAIHLKSDVGSKASLPIPIISTISPSFAEKLAQYGLDTANVLTVGKQASLSILINTIIAMLHRLLYDGKTSEDEKLYEVRTRKILMYSNAIAAGSNVLVVAFTQDLKKLDIGGIGVAIYRLITDTKFIYSVKREFVFGTYDAMVMGDPLPLK